MPELPEVETLKRELKKALTGRRFARVEILWSKTIRPDVLNEFTETIKNREVLTVERRAKILIIGLSGDHHLLAHLKMTGQLIFKPRQGELIIGGHPERGGADGLPNKFTRLIFYFSDGSRLFFNDLRKFGWMRILPHRQSAELFAKTGVEPLSREFSFSRFQEILKRYSNRKIKQLLLDQTLIAGLGNIYVDESCFLARIRPTRITNTLTLKEQEDLHQGIIEILKLAIKKKGTSAKNYLRSTGEPGGFVPHLNVYGREGEKCKGCKKGVIEKIKLNGRGTHFCPNCQK